LKTEAAITTGPAGRDKIIFSWSGGKDSAFALHELRKDSGVEVTALLTTVTGGYNRVSMHGVRETLLDRQAASLGIPLEKVLIPPGGSNDEYESRMREALARHRELGAGSVAFGDIFLEDLRRYREERLAEAGMRAVFPVWKRDTALLAASFIDSGFKAVVTCVDTKALDRSFAGAAFDASFLAALPGTVDPCGENGEFHSFVYDGPGFREPVRFEPGGTVLREERFCYADLVPIERGGRHTG